MKLLPAPVTGEIAFALCKYGSKERIYRLRLPADASQSVLMQHRCLVKLFFHGGSLTDILLLGAADGQPRVHLRRM